MYVFVCYKKCSVTFDPNNAKFTQNIDDCEGWVMNFIRPKTVQNWLEKTVLGHYEKVHFVYRWLVGARV